MGIDDNVLSYNLILTYKFKTFVIFYEAKRLGYQCGPWTFCLFVCFLLGFFLGLFFWGGGGNYFLIHNKVLLSLIRIIKI